MEPSPQELVAAMHQAVQDTPSLKSKFNATVEFRFDDVKERVDISKKGSSSGDPDLIVTTSLSIFHQLLNKKLTPQQAFMQGKLKIKGKVRLFHVASMNGRNRRWPIEVRGGPQHPHNLSAPVSHIAFRYLRITFPSVTIDGPCHEAESGVERDTQSSETEARQPAVKVVVLQ